MKRLFFVQSQKTGGNLVTAPAWPAHPQWLSQFPTVMGARISL